MVEKPTQFLRDADAGGFVFNQQFVNLELAHAVFNLDDKLMQLKPFLPRPEHHNLWVLFRICAPYSTDEITVRRDLTRRNGHLIAAAEDAPDGHGAEVVLCLGRVSGIKRRDDIVQRRELIALP